MVACDGALNEKVNKIAREFNESQNDFVQAVYKGNYAETMTAAVAAFRARKHPHIVQILSGYSHNDGCTQSRLSGV